MVRLGILYAIARRRAIAKEIIYVDHTATGDNNGTSWANAYTDLQEALNEVAELNPRSHEIWVAEGAYSSGPDRLDRFSLSNNTQLYGGFSGTEVRRSQRNPGENITTLSGSHNKPLGNSYHVVVCGSVDEFFEPVGIDNFVIDGFYIVDGNADATGLEAAGGGLAVYGGSGMVNNCVFQNNNAQHAGGAVFNYRATDFRVHNTIAEDNTVGGTFDTAPSGGIFSNINITSSTTMYAEYINCIVRNNEAVYSAGILFGSDGGYPPTTLTGLVKHCDIINNTATGYYGAVTNRNSTVTVTYSRFLENGSEGFSGALSTQLGFTEAVNNLFVNNTMIRTMDACVIMDDSSPATETSRSRYVNNTVYNDYNHYMSDGAAQVILAHADTLFSNGIVWQDHPGDPTPVILSIDYNPMAIPTIRNTCVFHPIADGEAIITQNPVFQNIAEDDFSLSETSPCLNFGSNDDIEGYTLDLAGNPRIFEEVVDLGCYEYQGSPVRNLIADDWGIILTDDFGFYITYE